MKIINLIPAKRQAIKAGAERRRTWYAIGGGWSLLMLAIYGGCYAWLGVGADPPGVRRQIELTERQINEANKTITTLRPAIAELQAHLDTNRSVGRQPDWSLLLSLVSAARPDDVVLHGCHLQTSEDVAGAFGGGAVMKFAGMNGKRSMGGAGIAGDPDNAGFVVRLRGYGRSQSAVSQYTLRLEQMGLFEKVNLMKVNREPYLSTEALAFQIDCTIRLNGAATAGSGAPAGASDVKKPGGRSTP